MLKFYFNKTAVRTLASTGMLIGNHPTHSFNIQHSIAVLSSEKQETFLIDAQQPHRQQACKQTMSPARLVKKFLKKKKIRHIASIIKIFLCNQVHLLNHYLLSGNF